MRQPIALLLNDLHIDKDHVQDFTENWNEALTICKENEIYDIVIGGDIFTSRSSQTLSVLLAVRNAFRKAIAENIVVTAANGNHDLVNQEEIEGYCHLYSDYPGIDVVDVYKILEWDDCDFQLVLMSYWPETGSFLDKLKLVKEEVRDVSKTILYIHEGIKGALGDFEVPTDLPQEIFGDFKAVLVGHYHNQIHIKGTEIYYIGSSRQNNFGEDDRKGYTILYDDGSWEFTQNEVNLRYATEDVNIKDIDEKFMEHLRGYSDCSPYPYRVRVRIKCTEAEAKTFDKQLLLDAGANKVEFITEKVQAIQAQASGIDEKYDKDGIRKEYLSFCESKDIDSKLGLNYLDKI